MMPPLTRENRHTVQTLLDAAALQDGDGDAPALIFVATDAEPVHISRAEFRRRVHDRAAQLTTLGVQSGAPVVLAYTQNVESIISFWALMLLGALPSMFPTLTEKLDPDIYMHSMAELVRLSGVQAILTADDFAPDLRAAVDCAVYSTAHIASQPRADVTPHVAAPDDVAFLQHSSGTTGLQKGVALSHKSVLNQLAAYSDAIALTPDDVIVSWLPLYHDMGLIAGFLLPLVQGVPLVLMSPFDWVRHPALLLRAIDTYRGTLCWLPNFAYNHSARRIRRRDSDGLDLSSMRMFINCSEPVYHASHTLFAERFAACGVTMAQLKVSYAMAENTFAVTQTPPDKSPALDIIDTAALERDLIARPTPPAADGAQVRVSCGPPIAGTQVQVIDANGEPLPERHVGEIVVRSDCMLSGYYRRPDLNPFTSDGWYRTGDRGYIAAGEVYIVGRSKDLIINAGKNVFPQDIEAVVNTVEGVHPGRAVVFGVPDEREGTELIAVVAEVDAPDKDLSRRIRQAIASSTTVSAAYVTLVEAGWLIKTSSGKIARAANRDKWLKERQ